MLAEITDHTGAYLLPQVLPEANFQSRHLNDISQSLLTWPEINCPTKKCWTLWSKTIRKLFTGSATGSKLQERLGTWNLSYNTARFWKWRYSDSHRILYQQNLTSHPRAALITQTNRTHWQISAMIPTNLTFDGPPVTPHDIHHRHVNLPIISLPAPTDLHNIMKPHKSLIEQLHSTLPIWQRPLFGPIR